MAYQLLENLSHEAQSINSSILEITFQLDAVQQLSHGAATMCADASAQEIHQKTVAKYGVELRSELFGLGKIVFVGTKFYCSNALFCSTELLI